MNDYMGNFTYKLKKILGSLGLLGSFLILYRNDPKIDRETLLSDKNTAASSEGTLRPVPSAQKAWHPRGTVLHPQQRIYTHEGSFFTLKPQDLHPEDEDLHLESDYFTQEKLKLKYFHV